MIPDPDPSSTCLVTGASSGIGAEFATQLARLGHNVTLVARREARLAALAGQLENAHGVAVAVEPCDLADSARRDRLVAGLAERELAVELLVNNAGFAIVGDFWRKPEDQVEMVRLNAEAVVALTGAFLPAMVARGRGAVINVASAAGFQPFPAQAVYGATKAFVLSFTEALAAELKGTGVTATALCPGPVATEFTKKAGFRRSIDDFPSFALSSPERIARAGIRGARRGKRLVTPGFQVTSWSVVSRYSPRWLSSWFFAGPWRRIIGE